MAKSAQSMKKQFKQLEEKAKLKQEEELRNKMTVKTVLLCWNRQRTEQGHSFPKLPVMKILYAGGYIGDIYAEVTPGQLQVFLNHVVKGEQDEAEAMLKQNPNLALASGTVTDPSGCKFEEITALQYAAFWALDWHMGEMLLKYISLEAARIQAIRFTTGSWVTKHGEHAGNTIQRLIDAIQFYIDNNRKWTTKEQYIEHWTKQVGGAQLLLPMHVIHEYCRPDRPFEPCPSFVEATLPRTTKLDGGNELSRSELGSSYGLLRHEYSEVIATDSWVRGEADIAACIMNRLHGPVMAADIRTLASLLNIRRHQRDELINQLTQSAILKAGPKP